MDANTKPVGKIGPDGMLRVLCPDCGFRIKAPREAAGKAGHCPQCGSEVFLPWLDPEPVAKVEAAPTVSDDELAAAEDEVGADAHDSPAQEPASGDMSLLFKPEKQTVGERLQDLRRSWEPWLQRYGLILAAGLLLLSGLVAWLNRPTRPTVDNTQSYNQKLGMAK